MDFTGERFMPGAPGVSEEMSVEHLHRYHAMIGAVRDRMVLDAACGEGYGSDLLAASARQVHGIDLSAEAIAHAKQRYPRKNLAFTVSSVAKLDFADATFDVAVSFETIEHVDGKTQEAFLRELRRVLKPDGVLVISTPDKHTYSEVRGATNHFHEKEFYPDEFREFLKREFSSVELFFQRYVLTSLVTGATPASVRPVSLAEAKPVSGRYVIAVCGKQGTKLDLESFVDDQLGLLAAKDQHIVNLEKMRLETSEALALAREQLALKDSHIKNLEKAVDQNGAALEAARKDNRLKTGHIENLEAQVREIRGALDAGTKQNALKDDHIANLERSVIEVQTALEAARAENGLKADHIANLERSMREVQTALDTARKENGLKDGHIANLEGAMRETTGALEAGRRDLALKADHIANLQAMIDELSPAVHELRAQAELKDNHIRNLEAVRAAPSAPRNGK